MAATDRPGASESGQSLREVLFAVPDMHCGACMRAIERGLGGEAGVALARANLTQRRVRVVFDEARISADRVRDALAALGFPAEIPDRDAEAAGDEARYRRLLLSLAVAGFAAGNVMLLSVSVWAGADASTRDLFHWISAAIAIPAVLWAGRPFFASAAGALRARRLNMDVPISLALVLALLLSLAETAQGGEHAYFDAAVTLLFFLLIGRTLDHLMRRRAVGAAGLLARLAPREAVRIGPDGRETEAPVAELAVGDLLLVRTGERVPVDGTLLDEGASIDAALVSGEAEPVSPASGERLRSGVLNLGRAFRLRAVATADASFIAEMTRMMEAAESARLGYRRLSDRAAALYAPLVHGVAAATFALWWWLAGDPWQAAYTATAVLIITCPCALALAVPMVQVAASARLFRSGLLLRDGGALERLARIDRVLFDKTGTLTTGAPEIAGEQAIGDEALALAASLCRASTHPRSRAILELARWRGLAIPDRGAPAEIPGCGLELATPKGRLRLGRADWALAAPSADRAGETILSRAGEAVASFRFEETLRDGAGAAIAALAKSGLESEIVSGDESARVARVAGRLAIRRFAGDARPGDKQARLAALAAEGQRALMVGDGLNDGPALSAAHASMAPSEAADIGRNAADIVFLGGNLMAVPYAVSLARRARALMGQNLALCVLYNLVAAPLAVMGFATPLVAAVAMSLSSLAVTANAMRLALTPPLAEAGRP